MWEIKKTKEEIVAMLDSGKTLAEVAHICGISDTTLRRYRKMEGIEYRTRKESAALGRKRRYKDSYKRRLVFRKALRWVDSLVEMPAEEKIAEKLDDIAGQVAELFEEERYTMVFGPVDVMGMIQTRPERHLSIL